MAKSPGYDVIRSNFSLFLLESPLLKKFQTETTTYSFTSRSLKVRPTWTWMGSVPEPTTLSSFKSLLKVRPTWTRSGPETTLSSFKFLLRWLVLKNGNWEYAQLYQSIVESEANVNGVGTWDDNFIQKFICTALIWSLKVRQTWTWPGSVPEMTTLSSFKFHLRWLLKNGNYYVQL